MGGTDTPSAAESNDDLARFATIVRSAESVLTERLGRAVRLGDLELLSEEDRRNNLLRCRDLSGGSPSRFILKQVVAERYDPDDMDSWDTQRFFKDWAGADFLSGLGISPAVCPQCFGGDRSLGYFVVEDLGPHRSLVEPLLEGTAESATAALTTFAATLGRMHARTVGQLGRFREVCGTINEHRSLFEPAPGDFAEYLSRNEALYSPLGVAADSGFLGELESVHQELANPGPFQCYIHGDPCPDNVFFIGEQMVLIDFEFGHFGHALRDALYGRMPFPTCWCCNRVPENVVESMESVYRAELVNGCPQAGDDRQFQASLVRVCAHWTLGSLQWHLENSLKEDNKWGIATVRPRVLTRIETFLELAESADQLPALRSVLSRLLDALHNRWPDSERLPVYPAFR